MRASPPVPEYSPERSTPQLSGASGSPLPDRVSYLVASVALLKMRPDTIIIYHGVDSFKGAGSDQKTRNNHHALDEGVGVVC